MRVLFPVAFRPSDRTSARGHMQLWALHSIQMDECVNPGAHEEDASTMLRHPVISGVKDVPYQIVTTIDQVLADLFDCKSVSHGHEPGHILQYKEFRQRFANDTDALFVQLVARVVNQSFAGMAVSLTWESTCEQHGFPYAYPSSLQDGIGAGLRDVCLQDSWLFSVRTPARWPWRATIAIFLIAGLSKVRA